MSTKIEWADKTTNIHVGCNKKSAGCTNCYAIRMAWRLMHNPKMGDKYAGTVEKTAGGNLNWTGKINYNQDVMQEWLTNKKPTHYFPNSMSDLFHEKIPFNEIYKVFEMMHLAHWHSFQVLTKRAERLGILHDVYFHLRRNYPDGIFPLPNVMVCVSVENQVAANERIPLLIKALAAKRGLSMEPLLGPVDIGKAAEPQWEPAFRSFLHRWLNQVITGGESGPNARPMHPDWVRSIRDQCAAAGVPFFFKQWGMWLPSYDFGERLSEVWSGGKLPMYHSFADGQGMNRVGKHLAGRLLDGVEHNGMAF